MEGTGGGKKSPLGTQSRAEQTRHTQEPWLSETHREHGDSFGERVRRVSDIRERGNQIWGKDIKRSKPPPRQHSSPNPPHRALTLRNLALAPSRPVLPLESLSQKR